MLETGQARRSQVLGKLWEECSGYVQPPLKFFNRFLEQKLAMSK